MIKKIICPTDFSQASTNAIEYAAKFARKIDATLTLLHVQPISIGEGVSLFSGGGREAVIEAKNEVKLLDEICFNTNKMFKVSCSYEIIPSISSFEKAVAVESRKFDLTIIGTNGADNMYQLYFGSHSFRVAKKEQGPVIIVPEECPYKDLINIAFASDCKGTDALLLQQLKQLTIVYNPHVHVIHISEKDTVVSREVYHSFCNLTDEALNYDQQIRFRRIIHENKADAIDNFVERMSVDLLAVSMEEHGFLYRMFHRDLIKKLTSNAGYPVLILHK